MAEWLTTENLIALVTLTCLEIVLGIDNIIFVAILTDRLPHHLQKRARQLGLMLAMVTRILLLLAIRWVMGLTATLFTVVDHAVSGKDLILFLGGLFLIGKATVEIHEKLEEVSEGDILPSRPAQPRATATMSAVLLQIMLLDMVFSLDSVITAVGMARSIVIMVLAVILAVGVMLVFANAVAEFVKRNPTLKMLALSFLILVGVVLVVEAAHIERVEEGQIVAVELKKGYVYFAMAFSLVVELLNLKVIKGLTRQRRARAAKRRNGATA